MSPHWTGTKPNGFTQPNPAKTIVASIAAAGGLFQMYLPIRCLIYVCAILALTTSAVRAQEGEATETVEEVETVWPLDDEGRLVRFDRDIVPLLREKCLECHGPDDAKNDFRVDDRELMMDYIEAEDAESSTLYVDYLTIDDEDMLMPPKSHGGPLSAGELALIRVWINEGADWPEDFEFAPSDDQAASSEPPPAPPEALADRVWIAQGFLHPATVHFPIALLTVGALFVVLGWIWPSVGTQIPMACILLGAISAVASTLMGWAFAPEQGYGSGWNLLDWDREVDVHRWSGLIVTVVSCVFAVIALMATWKQSASLTKTWKVGLLVCAGMVGAVGHQGGEMSYGADFYPRAWRILTGAPENAGPTVEAAAEKEPEIEVNEAIGVE